MKEFSLLKVYQLLEPSPVIMLTTACKGKTKVIAMSLHMMVEFELPLVGCVVSSADYSFDTMRADQRCVVAIPTLGLASEVLQVSNTPGRYLDKFGAFGLMPLSAERLTPPLVWMLCKS